MCKYGAPFGLYNCHFDVGYIVSPVTFRGDIPFRNGLEGFKLMLNKFSSKSEDFDLFTNI